MLKVLLVDDESTICEGMKALIDWELYGYATPESVENGYKALSVLKNKKYNLVITDIRMPGIDGLELSKAIKNNSLCNYIIIMSGYKDFEYARKAIEYGVSQYLLKPIDEEKLVDILVFIRENIKDIDQKRLKRKRNLDFMRKSVLQNIAYEIARNQENMKDYILNQDIFPDDCYYTVVLVANIRSDISAAITEIAWILIEKTVIVFKYDGNTIGILIMHSKENEKIEENIHIIHSSVLRKHKETICIVGPSVFGQKNLIHALYKVPEILEVNFYFSDSKFLYYDDLRDFKLSELPIDFTWNPDLLCHYLMENNDSAVSNEIENLMNTFIENKVRVNSVIQIITSLLLKIISMISSINGDVSNIFGEHVNLEQYKMVPSIGELEKKIKIVCKRAMAYIENRKSTRSYTYLQSIIEYIKEHYREDISIKSIADSFQMNPAYLGRKFKKIYGIGITEYVHNYRIDQAKKMIFEDRVQMSLIYSRIGYSNPDTYYMQFKKITGMNPSQYKSVMDTPELPSLKKCKNS